MEPYTSNDKLLIKLICLCFLLSLVMDYREHVLDYQPPLALPTYDDGDTMFLALADDSFHKDVAKDSQMPTNETIVSVVRAREAKAEAEALHVVRARKEEAEALHPEKEQAKGKN